MKRGQYNSKVIAFDLLYEHYFVLLCLFASKYNILNRSVEDIVQDVFLKVWQSDSIYEDPEKMKAHLYVMTRNHCLNLLRKDVQLNKYSDKVKNDYEQQFKRQEEWSEQELLRLIQNELATKIKESIDSLPPPSGSIFKLSYFERLKESEIAAKLKISIATVKKHKSKAKKLLKELLQNFF